MAQKLVDFEFVTSCPIDAEEEFTKRHSAAVAIFAREAEKRVRKFPGTKRHQRENKVRKRHISASVSGIVRAWAN